MMFVFAFAMCFFILSITHYKNVCKSSVIYLLLLMFLNHVLCYHCSFDIVFFGHGSHKWSGFECPASFYLS